MTTFDRPLDRRSALLLLGGLGLAGVVGCSSGDGDGAAVGTSTSGVGSGNDGVAEIPDETAGPYPGDGSNGPNVLTQEGVVRRDITRSFGSSTTVAEGIPLTIELVLEDAATGKPLGGAAVYLWHCDREGRYSMYSSGVTGENYLRGVQVSDAEGKLSFTSVFPGCYSGRWPHAHFEVYPSLDEATKAGTPIKTSQLALPDSACDAVYTTDGYEASVRNRQQVSLAGDNVFGDDGAVHQLATTSGDVQTGYTATLAVPC